MRMTQADKPRLLVLSSTFPRWPDDPEPGFVFELARRLTNRFDVTVLAPHAPGSQTRETLDRVRVIRFRYAPEAWERLATHGGGILDRLKTHPLNHLLVPPFLLGELVALTRLLRQERFAVIHAHWLIPQGLLAVLALWLTLRRVPLVCTSHGGDLYGLRGFTLRRIMRGVMGRAASVTVVSNVMRKHVLAMGVESAKVSIIPMGVDLKQQFAPDPSTPRAACELLFVGRLVEKKGLSILLDALALVAETHSQVMLTVAGDGPLGADLRRRAKTLGLSARVNFLGMVAPSRLPALYRRATLCVAPFIVARSGNQEGLGLVLVEALGCGCPVVASDLLAVRDVIRDGETGVLVPSGDPQALAAGISGLLTRCRTPPRPCGRGARLLPNTFRLGRNRRTLFKLCLLHRKQDRQLETLLLEKIFNARGRYRLGRPHQR